jgi:hypothetical protein
MMRIISKANLYILAFASIPFSIPSAAQADYSSPQSPTTLFWPCCGGQGPVSGSLVSNDGRFRLTYQNDGNFVLYQGNTPLWSSHTALSVPTGGYTAYQARFQADGNLVVYDYYAGAETPVWASNTDGNPGSTLNLQNDGNLVIYNASGKAIWSTKTCCR